MKDADGTRRTSQKSDSSDGGDKPARARAACKTPKDKILSLRDEARALEIVVLRLQRKRQAALSPHVGGTWKQLAFDQSEERAAAVLENKKLRRAMDECRQLSTSLQRLLKQPELGSIEDNEWRTNTLGYHPRRRHLNADRIMDQLYRRLPGWAITSGLVDASQNTRYSRREYTDQIDQAMHLEVDVCRQFRGHYVDVATAVWRYFAREDLKTGAAASVRVETSEILGDGIRHNTTGFRMVVDGREENHTTHQLCRRVDEDARIVIMWKAVTEDLNLSGANHRFTENADGWISFEKAQDPTVATERCLMKCSSMALVLPLVQVGYGSGAYLERLVRTMNIPLNKDDDDNQTQRLDHAERARRVFADFLFETLWRHVDHIEQLAGSASLSRPHDTF